MLLKRFSLLSVIAVLAMLLGVARVDVIGSSLTRTPIYPVLLEDGADDQDSADEESTDQEEEDVANEEEDVADEEEDVADEEEDVADEEEDVEDGDTEDGDASDDEGSEDEDSVADEDDDVSDFDGDDDDDYFDDADEDLQDEEEAVVTDRDGNPIAVVRVETDETQNEGVDDPDAAPGATRPVTFVLQFGMFETDGDDESAFQIVPGENLVVVDSLGFLHRVTSITENADGSFTLTFDLPLKATVTSLVYLGGERLLVLYNSSAGEGDDVDEDASDDEGDDDADEDTEVDEGEADDEEDLDDDVTPVA